MIKTSGLQAGTEHVQGTDLYYEIAGDGPALVLAHAGFVDRRMWDEQFTVFAEHYRVIRYDRRGFGNSKMTPGSFSHRRDLHGLLARLGLEHAHLLGCSAGGGVMIDFALEHPQMVTSLVLVSSAVGGYQFQGDMPKPMQDLSAAIQSKELERAANIAVQIWIDGPQRGPDQVPARIRERAKEMSLTALPNAFAEEQPLEPTALERLSEISVPTLVIVGEMDDPSTAAIGKELASRIPNAREEVISGAAHLPNMEKPEEFNRMVLEFLRQVSDVARDQPNPAQP